MPGPNRTAWQVRFRPLPKRNFEKAKPTEEADVSRQISDREGRKQPLTCSNTGASPPEDPGDVLLRKPPVAAEMLDELDYENEQ